MANKIYLLGYVVIHKNNVYVVPIEDKEDTEWLGGGLPSNNYPTLADVISTIFVTEHVVSDDRSEITSLPLEITIEELIEEKVTKTPPKPDIDRIILINTLKSIAAVYDSPKNGDPAFTNAICEEMADHAKCTLHQLGIPYGKGKDKKA